MRQVHFVVFKWLESLRKLHPLNHCQFAILRPSEKKKIKTIKTIATTTTKNKCSPFQPVLFLGPASLFYDLLSKKLKRRKKKKIGVTFNTNYSTILSNSDTFHESYIDIFYVNSS